jgi:hypothetical protein
VLNTSKSKALQLKSETNIVYVSDRSLMALVFHLLVEVHTELH